MKHHNRFYILSAKKWVDYYPLQVVYEWEEVLSHQLSIPIDYDNQPVIKNIADKPSTIFIQKFIRHSFLWNFIDSSFNYLKRKKPGQYVISFLLNPIAIANHYIYQSNSIVILLDVYPDKIGLIPKWFKNKLIFVTNIEVIEYFKGHTILQKLRYVPLSISDKYYTGIVPVKKIDVLQMGRKNTVLHNWMLKFTEKYPNIEYVYSKKRDDDNYYYFSTTRGELTDATDTREAFMDFLGSAKVSLLSSPGIDGGEISRTGGFNFVTPRFYESAVKYCYMIGRYPDSPDFIINNVKDVCERPETYEEFEQTLLHMLQTPFTDVAKYDSFIQQHLTSTVSTTIGNEINKL
jgi:hypothetical protein